MDELFTLPSENMLKNATIVDFTEKNRNIMKDKNTLMFAKKLLVPLNKLNALVNEALLLLVDPRWKDVYEDNVIDLNEVIYNKFDKPHKCNENCYKYYNEEIITINHFCIFGKEKMIENFLTIQEYYISKYLSYYKQQDFKETGEINGAVIDGEYIPGQEINMNRFYINVLLKLRFLCNFDYINNPCESIRNKINTKHQRTIASLFEIKYLKSMNYSSSVLMNTKPLRYEASELNKPKPNYDSIFKICKDSVKINKVEDCYDNQDLISKMARDMYYDQHKKWMEENKKLGNQYLMIEMADRIIPMSTLGEIAACIYENFNIYYLTNKNYNFIEFYLDRISEIYCSIEKKTIMDDTMFTTKIYLENNEILYKVNENFTEYVSIIIEPLLRLLHEKEIPNQKYNLDTPLIRITNFNTICISMYWYGLRYFLILWVKERLKEKSEVFDEYISKVYESNIITEPEKHWYTYKKLNLSTPYDRVFFSNGYCTPEYLRQSDYFDIRQDAERGSDYFMETLKMDNCYRGFLDKLRLKLISYIFTIGINVLDDDSDYILHLNETRHCDYFQQVEVPFIFYMGGRYKVCVYDTTYYVNSLPYIIKISMLSKYFKNIVSKEPTKTLEYNVKNEKTVVDHFYSSTKNEYYDDKIRCIIDNDKFSKLLYKNECINYYHYDVKLIDFVNENFCNIISDKSELCDFQKKFSRKESSSNFDDGDNIYDTISLWIVMMIKFVTENDTNTTHRANVTNMLKSISKACGEILTNLKKNEKSKESKEIKSHLTDFIKLNDTILTKIK